jgi:acyl carrier protein
MSREAARAALERVFREVFDDDDIELSENLSREDVPTWDSLGHIRLVAAIEESFGLSFTIEQIEKMTSAVFILDMVTGQP